MTSPAWIAAGNNLLMGSMDVLKTGRSAHLYGNLRALFYYCCALAVVLSGLVIVESALVEPLQAGPAPQSTARLTLEEVLELVRSRESEELIVARIKRNGRPFDLSVEERTELKREGISETILKYLVEPSLPYTPPTPGVVSVVNDPPKDYPDDEFASKIPPEPGFYLIDKAEPNRIDLKTLVASKQGGLSSRLSMGLIGRRVIGTLVGATARSQVTALPAIFYFRIAEPNKIEELALSSMDRKEKTRELEFSSDKQGKVSLKVDGLQQFDPHEAGPRLYRLTVTNLQEGEYFFYLIGSADPEKGIQGKGYDFGVH